MVLKLMVLKLRHLVAQLRMPLVDARGFRASMGMGRKWRAIRFASGKNL